jgi:hypothetical protein
MPVLFSVLRAADDSLREYMLEQLTRLVGLVRQHARRFLPDLLALVHEHWGKSSRVMHSSLQLLAELSTALRWAAGGRAGTGAGEACWVQVWARGGGGMEAALLQACVPPGAGRKLPDTHGPTAERLAPRWRPLTPAAEPTPCKPSPLPHPPPPPPPKPSPPQGRLPGARARAAAALCGHLRGRGAQRQFRHGAARADGLGGAGPGGGEPPAPAAAGAGAPGQPVGDVDAAGDTARRAEVGPPPPPPPLTSPDT